MRITRRRFLELAAAAAPAAVVVGCAASHGASEPIEPSRILDLDGRRASFDRDGANSVIRNQVDAGVRGPVGVRAATLPEPTPVGWRFTASNSMVAEILPSLDQFGLMVVVDAAGGATGRICTVGDASGSTLQLVLAAPDTLAVWWADVEVLRVQEASIRQRSCVFAVTVDSARIVHGFLNGAHAATSTRAVGLRGVQRLTLGSDGPDRSFTGVLQQLRCW
ncbi:MAG: hypothetical protein SW127_20800, partial [Actinomycetota bacterium]|nr:hypothetical protein [Actinomycetota bacterium]